MEFDHSTNLYHLPLLPPLLRPRHLRLYISTAFPSVSYLTLYGDDQKPLDDIRRYFTDSASPLFHLFAPEWLARVAYALDFSVNENSIRNNKIIDLLTCLDPDHQESQRPYMLNALRHNNKRTYSFPTESLYSKWQVDLCVANTDGAPLTETSPFAQLFKTSGLPLLTEVVAAPWVYYDLEKVRKDVFVLMKKEHFPPSPCAKNQLHLPAELWRDILRLVVAPEDKMGLIPTILCMRLINRECNEVATSLYHTANIFHVSRIVDCPIAFRPYLHRLHVLDEGIRLYSPPNQSEIAIPYGVDERHKYRYTLEESDIHIFSGSSCLDEVTLGNPSGQEVPVHVVGWRRETSELDVLEPAVVALLNSHLRQLEQLAAEATTIPASDTQQIRRKQNITNAFTRSFLWSPRRFHCLSPPGEALILALGRLFSFFVAHRNLLSDIFRLKVEVEFSIARNWGMEEAVRWFEEGKPWVRGRWPEAVEVLVYGLADDRVAKITEQLQWEYRNRVSVMRVVG